MRFTAKLLRRANTLQPYKFREGGQNPVSVQGVHWSNKPGLTALDPEFFGKGAAGRETRRLTSLPKDDPRWKRINFYIVEGDVLPGKEAVVSGGNLYEANFSNLYDIAQDPEGLRANANDANDLEMKVIEAGYDGYRSPAPGDHGSIVLLGTGPIPVSPLKAPAPGVKNTPLAELRETI